MIIYRHLFHNTLEYINIPVISQSSYIANYIWNSLNIHNYEIMTFEKAQNEQNIYIIKNIYIITMYKWVHPHENSDLIAGKLSDFSVHYFQIAF